MLDTSKSIALVTGKPHSAEGENLSVYTSEERELIALMGELADIKTACRRLGWKRKSVLAFIARPDVKAELHKIRRSYLLGDLQPKALKGMASIIDDPDASTSVRARLMLGVVALAQKVEAEENDANEPENLANLSGAELVRLASRLVSELQGASAIEVECTPAPQEPALSDLF